MRKGLGELRKACGLYQTDVAERLNVDQTTISKWENGEALPRADKLFLIAEVYGVKVDDIDLTKASKTRNQTKNGRININKPINQGDGE
jgi:transcriptional regulator with XRE-family HTH domain